MTFTPQPPPGLRTQFSMPDLPVQSPEEHHRWIEQFDSTVRSVFGEFATRLQYGITQTSTVVGVAVFGPAVTVVAVVFNAPEDDASYVPLCTPSWPAGLGVSAVTASGFTITSTVAPGGAGGTVAWAVVSTHGA